MLLGRISHLKSCFCFQAHLDEGQWTSSDAKWWDWPKEWGQTGKEACSGQGPTRQSRVHQCFKELVMTFCGEIACTHSSACTSLVSAAVKLCLFGFSCRTSLPKILQQQITIKFSCLYSVALLRKEHIEKSAYSCSRYHFNCRTWMKAPF